MSSFIHLHSITARGSNGETGEIFTFREGLNPISLVRRAYPFIFLDGFQEYSIQAIGTEERKAINQEFAALLTNFAS